MVKTDKQKKAKKHAKQKRNAQQKRSLFFGIVWGCILVGFAVFAILSKLVFSNAFTTNSSTEENAAATQTGIGLIDTYTGDFESLKSLSSTDGVTVTRYRWKNTDIVVADVVLTSPQEIQSVFAKDTFGHNICEDPRSMASRVNAAVLVNGDFYGLNDDGYVLRNGVIYRDTPYTNTGSGWRHEDLVIMNDGSFKIIKEVEISAQELINQGAWQLFSFGPALVENHEVKITEENYSKGYTERLAQRTAIGWISDLHYVFVSTDGRTDASTGLLMWDLADFMGMLGCNVAYNLDGGNSGVMVVNNEVANDSYLRQLSDAVYIAKK